MNNVLYVNNYIMVNELAEPFLPPIGGDRRLHEPQPTMVYPQLRFQHRAGRYRPGGQPLSYPSHCNRRYIKGVSFRAWDRTYTPLVPVASRTPAKIQLASEKRQLASESEVFTPSGTVSTRKTTVLWYGVVRTKGFLIWRWDLNLPGWC